MERRIYTEEQKQAYLDEYRNSNMSLTAFGKKVGIARQTIRKWMLVKETSTSNNFGTIDLKNIKLDDTDKEKVENIITFCNEHIKIELKQGFNKMFLKKIVEVLAID